MNKMISNLLYLTLGMTFMLVLIWTAVSVAQGEFGDGDRQMPYVGQIKFDGQPYHGFVSVMVKVDAGDTQYVETHQAVNAIYGRFKINIGAGSPVSGTWGEHLEAEAPIKVALGFRDGELAASDQEADYSFVTDEQALVWQTVHPVPFAYWSATSDRFDTTGDVNVGSAQITGALLLDTTGEPTVNSLTVGGLVSTNYGENTNGGLVLTAADGDRMRIRADNTSGTDMSLYGPDVDGVRFVVGGQTVMEATSTETTLYKDLVVDALDVQGDYKSFVREDEVELTVTAIGFEETHLGSIDGRACFLTGTRFGTVSAQLGKMDERCQIYESDGDYLLRATVNTGDEGVSEDHPLYCSARCLRW